ncbi:MAG: hypothetical protein HOI42_14015 [Candidatus Marinimicrobia bacterium]|nr:hypothetical protein [Candidatus Neomarinimicrobiota bacterium]MBT4174001.1 hypothetical protein [Candidatus Neomarinimicrobiota bacterium]MBT4853060.1 hypothetical protein [Candidatus Neomarinimicrobiota bacterium]MBT5212854.1 hypothetical protein [Candidatus Neomarinimicrobiota bacterium]MBT6217866.1 hypothetical protein [Candidatus Neomarinimicrobiota bacterium]
MGNTTFGHIQHEHINKSILKKDDAMKIGVSQLYKITLAALVVFSIGCNSGNDPDKSDSSKLQKLKIAKMILEYNATDDDAEIVMTFKGRTEGLAALTVFAPDKSVALEVTTSDRMIGLREFEIESAEPGISSVLAAFPEGEYQVEGHSISGTPLVGAARLSHDLPEKVQLHVDKSAGIVTWSLVPDAAGYSIELELEEGNIDLMKMNLDLPKEVTSFSIPESFRLPGDNQVGIAVKGKNGNIIVVEKEFSIE